MKLSIFENAMQKSHSSQEHSDRKSLFNSMRLYFAAKIKAYRIEPLSKINERLPHVHFKHESNLLNSFECLDQYELQKKEKEVKLLVEQLNGIVIKPNEVFSFWRNIDSPKYFSGNYVNLASIKVKGSSPAISQLTNLLYWIVLHSPLKITERHRHNFDLYEDNQRERPFGTGATCIYNYYDLKFINNTDSIYQVSLSYKNGKLTGELRSLTLPYIVYEVFEERQLVKKNILGNYLRHNVIYRRIMNTRTNKSKLEYITENHALMIYPPKEEDGAETCDIVLGDVPQ